MQITLLIEGQEKTFSTGFISSRKFRKALEMQEKLQGQATAKTIDEVVCYVVEVFGDKFTFDELYDGLASNKLIPTLHEVINVVIGDEATKLQSDDFLQKKNQ
ncbi:phage tail assembly chaperone G [Peribacillus loiseleuriae]|uniref:Phage protein n=1 Tax=Peribacillus loiseleuriae TaxID=1679170 RepID=A0A0K9GSI4_9BACI|nr:hypothetical protein [Peribacillus loiseleuriae]KMY49571.1 hypothetical protein AC625_08450 [Peribacillus loiseleuriae]